MKHFKTSCAVLALVAANPAIAQTQTTGNEIVVTATRRAEPLSKVPQSVTAFAQEALDKRGVKDMFGVVRATPGIQLDQNGFGNQTVIAIRGVSSTTGAATTGVYIDDIPIQSRNIGYSATNAFPAVFDIDRVEVLRGPQGTLFGAGSEGGTVRFITPQPSLDKTRIYARTEASATQAGSPSGEVGGSINTPLIPGKLGASLSAWIRRDGGYVNRQNANPMLSNQPLYKDVNWSVTKVARAALKWAPVDGLEIVPSIFFQQRHQNDSDTMWESLSNPSQGSYVSGQPNASPDHDRFYMPSLTINYRFGDLQFINSTSYFVRDQRSTIDYTTLWSGTFGGLPFAFAQGGPAAPNYNAKAYMTNTQRTFSQEARLQSTNPDARLNWVAGVFYSRSVQTYTEDVYDPNLSGLTNSIAGIPLEYFFGQGSLIPGGYSLHGDGRGVDSQLAAFGEGSLKLAEGLKVTVGLRGARTSFTGSSLFYGPIPGYQLQTPTSATEHPVTPKFAVNYQANRNLLVYANAAKGYRIGGVNATVNNSTCDASLARVGLKSAPGSYKSDSLWSYEVGAKGKSADGKFSLSASAFHVDWSDIQQNVALSCGAAFVANLGKAKSDGFDLQGTVKLSPGLWFDGALAYTNARLSQTIKLGSANAISAAGNSLVTHPWTVNLGVNGELPLENDVTLYGRAEYQFKSQGKMTASTDANTGSYIIGAQTVREVNTLSLRTGLRKGPFDLSLFVDNVTNSHTVVSRSVDTFNYTGTDHLPVGDWRNIILRPRTVGLTLVYRR